MSYILHAVYASPAGPQPVDYLIGDSFNMRLPFTTLATADPPAPVSIDTGGSILVPPPDATSVGVPEPMTLTLVALALFVLAVVWWTWRMFDDDDV